MPTDTPTTPAPSQERVAAMVEHLRALDRIPTNAPDGPWQEYLRLFDQIQQLEDPTSRRIMMATVRCLCGRASAEELLLLEVLADGARGQALAQNARRTLELAARIAAEEQNGAAQG